MWSRRLWEGRYGRGDLERCFRLRSLDCERSLYRSRERSFLLSFEWSRRRSFERSLRRSFEPSSSFSLERSLDRSRLLSFDLSLLFLSLERSRGCRNGSGEPLASRFARDSDGASFGDSFATRSLDLSLDLVSRDLLLEVCFALVGRSSLLLLLLLLRRGGRKSFPFPAIVIARLALHGDRSLLTLLFLLGVLDGRVSRIFSGPFSEMERRALRSGGGDGVSCAIANSAAMQSF